MRNIVIIPARGGSKRLPGKNMKELNGLPLIAHSILYAKASFDDRDIYVTTDDRQIKECALSYGIRVIDRPEALSGDENTTVSALKHGLETIGDIVENVILLQPTNPLRPENLLPECLRFYEENNLESLFTVSPLDLKFGRIEHGTFVPENYIFGQRSQDMEKRYFENGLLYITKAGLIANDTIITENATPYIVDHPFGKVDIDTPEDFLYAAFLLHNKS